MRPPHEHLERLVEREMELLRRFDDPSPSPGVLARVRGVLRGEADRASAIGSGRWSSWRRISIAAAVLLPVALLLPLQTIDGTAVPDAVDPAESLADWDVAIGRTTDVMTTLVEDAWLPERADGAPARDLRDDLDDLYESVSRAVDLGA